MKLFEILQSLLLFFVSVYFTCSRFAELAENNIREISAFILLGIGFEISRITLWIRAHLSVTPEVNKRQFKYLALFLTLISLLASLSKITANLESVSSTTTQADASISILEEQVKTYSQNEEVLLERLKQIPKEYVTSSLKLQAELQKVQERRIEIENKIILQKMEKISKEQENKVKDMFDVFGSVFSLRQDVVKLLRIIFMFLVAFGSEIGLLISVSASMQNASLIDNERKNNKKQPTKSRTQKSELKKLNEETKEEEYQEPEQEELKEEPQEEPQEEFKEEQKEEAKEEGIKEKTTEEETTETQEESKQSKIDVDTEAKQQLVKNFLDLVFKDYPRLNSDLIAISQALNVNYQKVAELWKFLESLSSKGRKIIRYERTLNSWISAVNKDIVYSAFLNYNQQGRK